ncbi:4Fe-4S dicluster domain-containing protein [Desulfonema magnum]|uniref:4Fe-4S ferredoxin iron-sulfur binding domain protein n=1 Tax=Desulfonema magnum TaxID=45655 RepID=A0A975BYS0_9BACT|nr:4Fe-4S dicluster domain-containing protein [Desulfonema magnum]QTA93490.1 4Fe-4S ferredoxin iron-sulfur binding domain protein [Desulfonema magnum]
MAKKPEYGLLIDYEYCTGCFACQVACCQENGWPAGMGGIQVLEIVQNLPNDKAYLTFMPFPTELCILCRPRTKKGLEPACVKHCMANTMKYGRLEDLAKEMGKKPKMVLWSPR